MSANPARHSAAPLAALLAALSAIAASSSTAAVAQETWTYTMVGDAAEPPTIELLPQHFTVHPTTGQVLLWDDGAIQILDAALANTGDRIPYADRLHCLHMHEGGRLYAAECAEARIHCFDLEERKLLWSTSVGPAEDRWIHSIDVSPKGDLVAVNGKDKLVLLDSKGVRKGEMPFENFGVRFSSDGKDLIAGRSHFDLSKPFVKENGKFIEPPEAVSRKSGVVYSRGTGIKGWLAIAENGVFEFTPGKAKWKRLHELTKSYTEHMQISPTRDGSVWLGSDSEGPCCWRWTGGSKPRLERVGLPRWNWLVNQTVVVAAPGGGKIYYLRLRPKQPKSALVAIDIAAADSDPLFEFHSNLMGRGTGSARWSAAGGFESDQSRFLPESGTLVALPPHSGQLVERGRTHAILEQGGEKSPRRWSLVNLDTREAVPLSIPGGAGPEESGGKDSAGKRSESIRWEVAHGGRFVVRAIHPVGPGGVLGEGRFVLYDVAEKKILREWTAVGTTLGPEGNTYSIRRDPEDRLGDSLVAESVTGEELWRSREALAGHWVSDDGLFLAGQLGLVDARTGKILERWSSPPETRNRRFIPECSQYWFFLSGGRGSSDGKLEARDLRTGAVTAIADLPKEVASIVGISPDGRWILADCENGVGSRLRLFTRS